MTRKSIAGTLLGLVLLTGCGIPGSASSPCDSLPRASQADIARANQGEEVETDVQTGTKTVKEKVKDKRTGKTVTKNKTVPVYAECDLVQGQWELDED